MTAVEDFAKRKLSDEIFMFTKRVDEPREVEGYVGVVQTTLTYEVEVRAFRECEFTLRWEGSANMAPEDGSEATEAKVVIQPYERRRLVVLQQQDLLAGWSLSIGSSWLERQPSVERCNAAVAETAEAIDAELRTAKTLDFGADAATIDHLNAVCEEHGVKFVDLEFPPVEASLFSAASKHAPKPGARKITWRRATDFLDPDKLDVFVQGVEPSDISQGALGDCWLLCSIAACTEFPWLITRMFQVHGDDAEPQSANPYGVYKVRLCKNGQWQYVRLDDYFPCYPGSGPVYAKTHEQQELWVPLVEKAMAKLCGTYDALRGGLPFEALIDLTGSPAEKYSFADEAVQESIKDGSFFERLKEWDTREYLMTASTPGEDKWSEDGGGGPTSGPGLVPGHAYSLIAVKELSTGDKLVQLRNPWGSFEWHGKWSDRDPAWTADDGALLAEVGSSLDEDDGLFWMAFDDVMHYFTAVNVCYIQPGMGLPSQYNTDGEGNPTAGHWIDQRRKGTFRLRGTASREDESDTPVGAGNDVINNSMYILHVPEYEGCEDGVKNRCWVSLHQEDERVETAKPYLDMGVTVLRIDDDEWYADTDAIDYKDMAAAARVEPPAMTLVGSTGVAVDRQQQLQVNLEPGRYLIVPFTTGCKFKMGDSQSKLIIEEAVSATGSGSAQEFVQNHPEEAVERGIVTTLLSQAPQQWTEDSDWYYDQDGTTYVERDVWFVPRAKHAFKEIFHRLDEDMDGVLNEAEFNRYCEMVTGEGLEPDTWAFLLKALDCTPEGLTPDGFLQYYWYLLQANGGDEEKLWEYLEFMGYDRMLHLNRARAFVMSVHSSFDVSLTQLPHCADVYEEALERPVKELGEARTMGGDGDVIVYTHKSGYWGVTLAVENNKDVPLSVKVDCSSSDNIVSSAGELDSTMVVPAGETKIVHHLMPQKQDRWSWGYSMQWQEAHE